MGDTHSAMLNEGVDALFDDALAAPQETQEAGDHPAPGAPALDLMKVTSDRFVRLMFDNIRFCSDLTTPAVWPSGESIATASGLMDRLADLHSVPSCSKKGMYDFLWIVAKLNELSIDLSEDPADGTANASMVSAWARITADSEGIEVVPPEQEDEKAQPVANCIAMLLLFQASGTITGSNQDTREQAMIAKATLSPACKNSKAFYSAFSRFDSSEWLSALVSDVLFTSASKVQRYFDAMGPLTKKYLMSHASAGSSFFERINHLQHTLGLRSHSVLRIYQAYTQHDLLPCFAVSHVAGSFAGTLLEGPLYLYTLWRLSGLLVHDRGERRKLMRVLSTAFHGALDQFKEGEAKAYRNAFGRTLNSKEARTRLKQKMSEHASELSEADALTSVHNRLKALDCTPLKTTSQALTSEVVGAICSHVGTTPPGGELEPAEKLKQAMTNYLAPMEVTKQLITTRTGGEEAVVNHRFPNMGKSTSREAYEVRFFELFKDFADTDVAAIPGEEDDLLRGLTRTWFDE